MSGNTLDSGEYPEEEISNVNILYCTQLQKARQELQIPIYI